MFGLFKFFDVGLLLDAFFSSCWFVFPCLFVFKFFGLYFFWGWVFLTFFCLSLVIGFLINNPSYRFGDLFSVAYKSLYNSLFKNG